MVLSPGSPEPLGFTPTVRGANIAVFSSNAAAIDLCLFDEAGEIETRRIRLTERTGDVHHAHVAGIRPGQRYGLRAHGPHDPANGHRFNANKLLVDPAALMLDRPFVLHPAMFGYPSGGDPDGFDATDSAPFMPKGILMAASAIVPSAFSEIDWPRTVLYEVHVRSFTRDHPDVAQQWRGTFAGLGSAAVVAYFVRLGITTLEVMPAAAWIDERHLKPLGLANVWGYNPAAFCAPDPRLAPGGWAEIRACVAAFHAAGIEVILDVVLNHSGEGDALGPTLSLRGLDNAAYYRLRADDPARYVDDAGCGNILALDRPHVVRLAMDALRAWAQHGGFDGFRFDLAATLGRREDGFDPAAPLLTAIAQDPVLRALKLIAEPWDIGPGGYRPGAFPAQWGEWNDRYRDDVRRFWRGDSGMLGALATRLSGSADVFAAKHRVSRSINYVTAHDGFTLADLVAYSAKHNEANGEFNRDGTDANHSWNHGIEGASEDPAVAGARARDQRNLLATLLLSLGTPMLSMGSERGHSQHGNNNAYAQDIGIDWAAAPADLADLVARLAHLRRSHPAFAEDRFLDGQPRAGVPDVQWLRPDGQEMTSADWENRDGRTLAVVLAAAGAGETAHRLLLVFHAGFEPCAISLPPGRAGCGWSLVLDTSSLQPLGQPMALGPKQARLELAARSVVALVEEARG